MQTCNEPQNGGARINADKKVEKKTHCEHEMKMGIAAGKRYRFKHKNQLDTNSRP